MAENNVVEILKSVVGELKEMARSETIIGKPVTIGDRTVIPIVKISVGFGAGGGKGAKDDGGGGTAGGGSVEPVGFIVIHKGKVQLIPMQESEMSIGKLLSFAPDVIKKVKEFREKREKKKSEKEEEGGEKSSEES